MKTSSFAAHMGRCAAPAFALLLASSAHAALNISTDATQNVSCSKRACTPEKKKAVLNVNDLKRMLSRGDVQIIAQQKTFAINIQTPFSWTSSSKLTLATDDLRFEQPVTVAGTGGVTINDSRTSFSGKGRLVFWDLNSDLSINGNTFTLAASIAQLSSLMAANAAGAYALANNYDASADGVYPTAPITNDFSGLFEGLGNEISNLAVSASGAQKVGLFSTASGAIISDIGLPHVNISAGDGASVGALAGGASEVFYSWATGKVRAGNSATAGGLIGLSGNLTGCFFSGSVVAGSSATIGGLSGTGNLTVTSWSSGSVEAGDDSMVGGLFGSTGSGVSLSHSSAKVKVANSVNSDVMAGGLIGYARASVDQSYATGSVSMGDGTGTVALAGGLVGNAASSITNSHATGAVSGGNLSIAGGLVGTNRTEIDTSFATGAVSGKSDSQLGGFAGDAGSNMANDYAEGAVSGGHGSSVGGFAGVLDGDVEFSYSTGAVVGDVVGGFGGDSSGEYTDDYWDIETSGTQQALGNGNADGILGLTTAQLQSGLPSGFDPQVWGQSADINNGYPYLLANPPPKGNKVIQRRPGPSRRR